MKRTIFILSAIFISCFAKAQNVGIGTTTPNANAALEIKSTNKGILIPRVSAGAKNAMTNVAKGMLLYDTTYSSFYYHDGNKWRPITDKNPDSLLTDYSGSPAVTANMNSFANTSAISGILYDNGGPAGNYTNNSIDQYNVLFTGDDSSVYYKVVVEQMNLESPFDSLLIYNANNYIERISITGTTTGTYYFPVTANLRFDFRSNSTNNLAGFKIRWSRIVASPPSDEQPPLYGWYFSPLKLAVRGGVQSPPNWTTDSLGRFSFSYGTDTKAKGNYSFSFGQNAEALNNESFAFGSNSSASGLASIAFGTNARATGTRAYAIGLSSEASGINSFAIGGSVTASGVGATAMGFNTTAGGNQSIATGSGTSSSGTVSTAMGFNTIASGFYSTAIGKNTTASGDTSFAAGFGTIASGKASVAMGDRSDATGEASLATGIQTTASGGASAAFGAGTNASGDLSTAFGNNTTASATYATAMGNQTTASGNAAAAMGYYSVSRGFAGTVVGLYNNPILGSGQTSVNSTTPLFIVGNGDNTGALSNALVVRKDGNIGIGTDVPAATLHIKHVAGGGLLLENVNDGNKWRIYSASGDNNLTFYNNAGTEVADIDDMSGAFNALSDRRYKKDIESMPPVLSMVMQLRPKQYHFNWQKQDEQIQLGFIAQDAYKLFPELVSYSKEKDLYKMNYAGFSTIAIKAIQEQQTIITDLQKQMEELKTGNHDLKKQNEEVKARLEKIEAFLSKKQ